LKGLTFFGLNFFDCACNFKFFVDNPALWSKFMYQMMAIPRGTTNIKNGTFQISFLGRWAVTRDVSHDWLDSKSHDWSDHLEITWPVKHHNVTCHKCDLWQIFFFVCWLEIRHSKNGNYFSQSRDFVCFCLFTFQQRFPLAIYGICCIWQLVPTVTW
jgi:hypothetical protein